MMDHMKTATVRDLRYNFPKVEALLLSGEEVELTKRGRVVGRIVPSGGELETKFRVPDFRARLDAIHGGRKVDTDWILDHNKGKH
jgi:antitoxin (DNA-binding transcriptional repressor) of toxin-antitoxin stability system